MSRLFNTLVFGDVIVSATTQGIATDPKFDELLASADALGLHIVLDQWGGTTPTVTVALDHSCDRKNWIVKNTAVIPSTAPAVSGTTTAFGSDSGSTPTLGFARLRILLFGSGTLSVRAQLYACGRSV